MNTIQSFDAMLKANGFAHTGDSVVEELKKALSTDNSYPGGAGGNPYGPLMLQNLDAVMTEVLINEGHFKMYNMLPKVPSSQPYYEYNEHKGFGSRRGGGLGFAQGGAPRGGISSFERKGIYNKFLGVKGGVTHQMLITGQNGGAFEDPTVRENKDRTLELLERLDRELIHGQKAIKDANGVEVNFDGFLQQLGTDFPQNVIDMKGAALTFKEFDAAAEDFITTGKQPSVNGYTGLMSPHVMSGLNEQYNDAGYVRNLKSSGQTGTNFAPGNSVTDYDTRFGTFKFDYSILLRETDTNKPVEAALAETPATPAAPTAVAAAATDSNLPGASFYYTVAAFNDAGESLGSTAADAVAPTAGQKVTVTLTKVAGATGYRIYRGLEADGSDAQWIARIPAFATATADYVDKNQWRTVETNGVADGLCVLIKPDPKDVAIAQMTPLIKMQLPQVDTTFPFLLLLYIVSVIKAPSRVKIFKNCGTYKKAA